MQLIVSTYVNATMVVLFILYLVLGNKLNDKTMICFITGWIFFRLKKI